MVDLITYHTIKGRYTAEELFNDPIFPQTLLRGHNTSLDGRPQVIRTVKQSDAGYVYGGLNRGTFFRKWARLSCMHICLNDG